MFKQECTVAIIDDDRYVLDALTELLDTVGYKCKVYTSADGFLQEFNKDEINCILLDVRMPGMSGIELQHKLNDMHVATPIIIMTGHGDITMAVQAMKDGAFEFIQKPFRDQKLLDAISKALNKDVIIRNSIREHKEINERINLLTERESQVVDWVLEGLSNKLIARELGVSDRTVELHRSHAMKKLQVNSVVDLVKMMMLYKS
jgi:FixJ family two-component response regulator